MAARRVARLLDSFQEGQAGLGAVARHRDAGRRLPGLRRQLRAGRGRVGRLRPAQQRRPDHLHRAQVDPAAARGTRQPRDARRGHAREGAAARRRTPRTTATTRRSRRWTSCTRAPRRSSSRTTTTALLTDLHREAPARGVARAGRRQPGAAAAPTSAARSRPRRAASWCTRSTRRDRPPYFRLVRKPDGDRGIVADERRAAVRAGAAVGPRHPARDARRARPGRARR